MIYTSKYLRNRTAKLTSVTFINTQRWYLLIFYKCGFIKVKSNYSNSRKIDSLKGTQLSDGTPNNSERIEIGPSLLAIREWETAGLIFPNLENMRKYRWKRLTQHIIARN